MWSFFQATHILTLKDIGFLEYLLGRSAVIFKKSL